MIVLDSNVRCCLCWDSALQDAVFHHSAVCCAPMECLDQCPLIGSCWCMPHRCRAYIRSSTDGDVTAQA